MQDHPNKRKHPMTALDVLAVLALVFSMAAYFQNKISKLWDAIVELDSRKLDIEP